MIKLHHLNASRGTRILWFLEESGLPYTVVHYQRDAGTGFSPDALRAVHPLGKSPFIEDGDVVIAESGAIVEYLCKRYDRPQYTLDPASPDWPRYLQCVHYAEGSSMLPFALDAFAGLLGEAGTTLKPRIESEVAIHLGYMSGLLGDSPWFAGEQLTCADFMLVIPILTAAMSGRLGQHPNLALYMQRVGERPAWQKAMAASQPAAAPG